MTLRFIDGFDHYSTAQVTRKWALAGTQTNLLTIVSPGRYGGGCMRFSGSSNSAYLTKGLPASASWVIGFAVRPPAGFPLVDSPICSLYDSGTLQCDIRANPGGILTVTRNATTLTGGTSTLALVGGAWNYVEWKVTIADSIAANSCKVRINGADAITVATGQDTKNSANASANTVYLGGISGGNFSGTGNWDYDDFYICDQAGSVNNDFLGDVRVETLFPGGVGNSSQWTPSAGANYTCVDENPATDDTDYVSSSTVAQKDTYALANLTSNPTSIKGIQTVLVARKADAGLRNVAAVLRSGGADYDGASAAVLDGYSCLTEIRETDPATSAAWIAAAIANLEAGVKLVS